MPAMGDRLCAGHVHVCPVLERCDGWPARGLVATV